MKSQDIVLHELSLPHSGDGFISGEELALRCGISRQAVWKAVNVLRAHGAKIEAVTNKGYHLAGTGSMLSEEAVNDFLPEELHAHVCVYNTIDSTNTEAKRRCAEISDVHKLDHTVIIAAQQTAGRGRLGRPFFSPADSGLYLSIIYAPSEEITSPAVLTSSAATGVCRALHEIYGVDAGIKWVNDVFLRGKKVCGILTEGVTDFETGKIQCAIAGIGINILPGSFPPELADMAGAVIENRNADTKRSMLAASVVKHVLKIYTGGEAAVKDAMSEYRRRSLLTGLEITVCPVIGQSEGNYAAVVQDVTDDAKLAVKKADGSIVLLDSGEVTLHSGSLKLR